MIEGERKGEGRKRHMQGLAARVKIVVISPIMGHFASFELSFWSSSKLLVTLGHENILKQVKYLFPTSHFLSGRAPVRVCLH